MPNDSNLSIIVKLQDDATAGLASLGATVKGLGDNIGTAVSGIGENFSKMGASLANAGNSIKNIGSSMTTSLTLPIVAAGYAVTETANKFQASMELIRTQAGASQSEVDKMTNSVLELAKSGETGQGPQKLADGLYHLESLGLRGSQALDTLKLSAAGADLGLADMEGVTNALGAAMVTGIKGTQTATEAMGLLDATIGQGNMRMDDMVAALGTGVLPAAKSFGLSLQDVGAALATLTDNGMRADESATRLRMTFSLLAAPTKTAQDALKSIGLSAYQLADDMRNKGLVGAIDDLNEHLKASGQTATQQAATLSEAFGGGRTSAAILTLTQQSDRLKSKFDAIGESAGSFQEKIDATKQTNLFKMNEAMASMQSTMITIGGTVGPILADVLQKVANILGAVASWWGKLNPQIQGFIVNILGLTAVIGPFLLVLGTLTSTLGGIFTAIGWILGTSGFGALINVVKIAGVAIAGLSTPVLIAIAVVVAFGVAAYELWKHWDVVSKMLQAIWKTIGDTFQSSWTLIVNWFNASVVKPITASIQSIIDAFNTMVSIVSKPVNVVTNAIGNALSSVGVGKLPSHEMGGFVNAPRGTAVPIIAHGGEQIIPAEGSRNSNGGNVTVNINNPSVRSDSDLVAMKKMIDQIMRPLMMNAKVKFA